MKKLYKCRVCGYVIERKDAPGICPACGVKGKIFEEYESPISKKRRIALELNMHSIMVHFPIAAIFATLTGMIDSKLRFKRIRTPLLKKKLVLACFFILISISLFVFHNFLELNQSTNKIIVLICSIILLGIATPLGLIGGRLIDSKVRG